MKIKHKEIFKVSQLWARYAITHDCSPQWDLAMQLLRKAYGFEVKK